MRIGDVLAGRFVLERLAGRGGMGSVYFASDRKTAVPVAVKAADLPGRSLDDRFLREAAALGQVAHPSVVRYVSSGRTDAGEAYLVMEWLEGESLADRLRREPLSVQQALTATRRAAEGLAAAHANGVVHRDVKPSNLYLVDGNPSRLKVVDFGVARAGAELGLLTSTGVLLGTLGYMAPEQAHDAKRATERADVYSLGCVLFECLTGRRPHLGGTPIALLSRLLVEDIPAPSTLCPGLSVAVDALVLAMLDRSPPLRPSAAEVAERAAALEAVAAIDPALPTVAVSVRPASGGERWTATVLYARAPTGVGEAATPSGTTDEGESRRGPFGAAVAAAARAFGGTATAVDGHTWLFTFPEQGPASDRARRAAACALALRDAGFVRVVVATARDDSTAHRVAGPAIDRAVELLDTENEPAGTVLLDTLTASLIDTAYDVDRSGRQPFLIGRRADQGASRLLMGKQTPFVGREKELAVLEATLVECLDEATARVVLITAPPGIGKSRLRMELMARVARRAEVKVLLGRGEIGTGVSFSLARQLVVAAAGLSPNLSPGEKGRRLEAYIANLLPEGRAREIAEFLAETLGLPFSAPPSPAMRTARLDSETMSALVLDAFDGWVTAERAAAPLLVVIEDLHWADSASVDMIVRAARLGAPALLVVLLSRPEAPQLFPALVALEVTLLLRLPGLGARSAERLVRSALGDQASSSDVARVVSLADGNAFFIEELVRAVVEDRSASLPESVLAMVEARLAALPPDARSVLRAASVLGERFRVEAVCELVSDAASAREWLETLADREVLERPGGERTSGATEFLFRHALLREAAYAQLEQVDRVSHHARAAIWLERQVGPDPVAVAEHWERAGDAVRAVGWLATAAEAALDAADLETGRRAVTRGLALGAEGVDRGRLRLIERWSAQSQDDAFEAVAEAVNLLPEESERWIHAVAAAFFSAASLGRPEAREYLGRLLRHVERPHVADPRVGYAIYVGVVGSALAGHLGVVKRLVQSFDMVDERIEPDPFHEIMRRYCVVVDRGFSGVTLAGVASVTALAPVLAAQVRTPRARFWAAYFRGFAFFCLGACEDAITVLNEALTVERAIPTYGYVVALLARALARTGAIADAEAVLTRYATSGGMEDLFVGVASALVLYWGGNLQEADARVRGFEPTVAGYPMLGGEASLIQSAAALARGDAPLALRLAEEGLERAAPTPLAFVVNPLRLERVRALSRLRREAEARDALREARDQVLAMQGTIEDADYREKYVDSFAETREIVRLAKEWCVE